jgi:ferredoxin
VAIKRRSGALILRVDPVLCDGFGHCHELAPDLVTMDEWGYPIIVQDPSALVDPARAKSARLAVRGCPRQALHLERLNESSARQ